MRSLRVFLLAALTVSCGDLLSEPRFQSADDPTTNLVAFTALAPGDEVRVGLHAHGCFHDVTASLVFRSEDGTVARLTGSASGNYARDSRRYLDTAVTVAELADLDQWLDYYRHLPTGVMCTSVTELDIALYRNDQLVRRERYLDDTCGGLDPGPLPETSFSSLTWPR